MLGGIGSIDPRLLAQQTGIAGMPTGMGGPIGRSGLNAGQGQSLEASARRASTLCALRSRRERCRI